MLPWNPAWGDVGDLGTHKGFLSDPTPLASTIGLELGHVASFVYATDGKPRLAFIMHPNFEGKCHALTLKYIERKVLLDVVWPHVKDGMSDPQTFYRAVFKPSGLYDKSYRTYLVNKISAVTRFRYSAPNPGSDAEMMEKLIGNERKESDSEFMKRYEQEIEAKSNK